MDGGRVRGQGSCPRGKIMRKGYRRKDGTYVKPSCIKDRGAPGKGPKLFKVTHPGILTSEGYSTFEPAVARHTAIERAVKKDGYAEIFRSLNNLRVWNKRVNPELAEKADRDIEYLRTNLCEYSLSGCPSGTRTRSARRSKARRKSSRRRSSGRRKRSPRTRRRSSARRRKR